MAFELGVNVLHPKLCPSVCLSIHLSMYGSFYPCTYLSIFINAPISASRRLDSKTNGEASEWEGAYVLRIGALSSVLAAAAGDVGFRVRAAAL